MSQPIKYLGIDWGEKRIGLALADSETKMALPFKTVADLRAVLMVIKEEDINQIVMGQPLKMGNASLPLSQDFLNFKNQLEKQSGQQVELIDERLSSQQADALSGDKKTKASRDEISAMLILQTYIDRLAD